MCTVCTVLIAHMWMQLPTFYGWVWKKDWLEYQQISKKPWFCNPAVTMQTQPQTCTLTSTYIYGSKYVVFWLVFNNSIKVLLQTRGSISCYVGYIVITQRLFWNGACLYHSSHEGLSWSSPKYDTHNTHTHTQSLTCASSQRERPGHAGVWFALATKSRRLVTGAFSEQIVVAALQTCLFSRSRPLG